MRVTSKNFDNYLRMNEDAYLQLLSLVKSLIQKQNTVIRDAIHRFMKKVDSDLKIFSFLEFLEEPMNVLNILQLYRHSNSPLLC